MNASLLSDFSLLGLKLRPEETPLSCRSRKSKKIAFYYMAQATSGKIACSEFSVLDQCGLRISSVILFPKDERKETLERRKNLMNLVN